LLNFRVRHKQLQSVTKFIVVTVMFLVTLKAAVKTKVSFNKPQPGAYPLSGRERDRQRQR